MSNGKALQPATPATPASKGTALALLAQRLQVAPGELERCLMDTAFKGSTPGEFITLVAVANQYNLNPMAREIYAFPKKGGGIVPLVPIDGWIKIINNHPDFDWWAFEWADEVERPEDAARNCPIWCEVTIAHKSRPGHPTVHREWLDETYRSTGPWQSNTKRMLKWKAISQAGRLAFGLSGVFDLDEAERISEAELVEMIPANVTTPIRALGAAKYAELLEDAQRYGYTEEEVLNTAATLGHEGPGEEMPITTAGRIYQGMKANPRECAQKAASGIKTPMVGEE